MLHWSVTDEPGPPAPQAETAPAAPLSPTERIAEILEIFSLREPELVAELLRELGRCDTSALAKLFGSPIGAHGQVSADHAAPADAQAAGRGEIPHAETGPADEARPTWSKPAVELANLQQLNPPEPKWDERGFRISPKLPSSFPRNYEPTRPRGTHWSR
jgi:hypothetical protein